jgi:MscS family membrane protein
MRIHVHFGWLLGLIVLLPLAGASAQEPTLKDVLAGDQEEAAPAPTPEEKPAAAPALAPMGPLDEFDRGVPRTSVEGFTAAALAADWERAVEYLDLRSLPPGMDEYEGTELAHALSVVLERALWIDLDQLSLEPEGRRDDGLPAYRDPVGVVETPEGKIPILLQRVPRGDGVSIWKFSNRTIGQVPMLYRYHGYGPLAEVLTELVPSFRLLGIESWQWVGMFGLGVVSFLLAWLLSIALARLLRVRQSLSGPRITRLVRGPIQFLVFVILFREGVHYLAPSLVLRAVLNTELFLIAAVSWTAFRVSDLLFDRSLEPLGREPGGVAVFLRPLRTASRTLIVLAGSVLWLQNVGFNVGALLAGLGIGGVALALAAQKSLEDVFGAITLFSSRPVRVGDFCRFGDRIGTVEEIGLRWTRVRTLDHTVVNVPNSEFAKDKLENYSERRRIWYHPRLRLRYETTPEQLRYVLVEARKLLYSHPRVLDDPCRIRFVGFGEWSLDLDVFAYVATQDYGEFLEIAEDLNLRLMDVVRRAGSGIALPSRTTYVESGAGVDAERRQAAEAEVGEWRSRRELFLPSFPEPAIAELRGALPYPPEGSPEAQPA